MNLQLIWVVALLLNVLPPSFCAAGGRDQDKKRNEVFVFSTDKTNWKFYDWSKITTFVEFGYHDDDLVRFAHKKNVTVSFAANFNKSILYDTRKIKSWVEDQMNHMRTKDLDGINIDFEDEINCTDFEARNNFVQLMELLRLELKMYKPEGQLSIDFAWSPKNIDNRCYGYQSLADQSDVVFVMAYDERSQIFGPCVAWANSPYLDTVEGVESFINMGIPKEKLVLGVPWYGYDYDCLKFDQETGTCFMREVPFRGVPCSDASGTQVGYSAILELLNSSSPSDWSSINPKTANKIKIISKKWDEDSSSPYLTYLNLNTGVYHQVWYDDYISLTMKYAFARSIGLAGVGFWEADSLDYSDSEVARRSCNEMWNALPSN